MCLQVLPALPHAPIDAEVGDTNDHARYNESQNEEELLRAGTILLQNGAGECGRFQAQCSPYTEQRWQQQRETQRPNHDQHQDDPLGGVQLRVYVRSRDQYVPIYSNRHHAEQ